VPDSRKLLAKLIEDPRSTSAIGNSTLALTVPVSDRWDEETCHREEEVRNNKPAAGAIST